jgi:hypothetical protein
MNYQALYDAIVSNAKSQIRTKKEQKFAYEEHHILPKCLGGTNYKINRVLLTYREHFICHKLLTKIHKNNILLWAALISLSKGGKITRSRDYQASKIIKNKKQSELIKNQWNNKKFRKIMKNKDMSFMKDEYYKKIKAASMKLYTDSEQGKKQKSEMMKKVWLKPGYAEKRNKKTSLSLKKRWADPAYKEAMSQKIKDGIKKRKEEKSIPSFPLP